MKLICRSFEKLKHTTWTDEGIEPGTQFWQDAIEKAIEDSVCVVALLSPNSKKSIWVKREITYAKLHGKIVFSVLIQGKEKDSAPISVTGAQHLDLTTNFNEKMSLLSTSIRKLTRSRSKSDVNSWERQFHNAVRVAIEQGASLSDLLYVISSSTLELSKQESAKLSTFLLELNTDLLIQKGVKQGKITYDDILQIIPDAERNIALLDQLMEKLLDAGITLEPAREPDFDN